MELEMQSGRELSSKSMERSSRQVTIWQQFLHLIHAEHTRCSSLPPATAAPAAVIMIIMIISAEREWFAAHPEYSDVVHQCGVGNLAKRINVILGKLYWGWGGWVGGATRILGGGGLW